MANGSRENLQVTMDALTRMDFKQEYAVWELVNNETGKCIMRAGILEKETHPGKMLERIRKFPNIDYTLRCVIEYSTPSTFVEKR